MAHRFPTEFPLNDLRLLYEFARDRSSHHALEAADSAWWIVGYGLGQLPDGSPVPTSAVAGEPEDQFEAFAAAVGPFVVVGAGTPQPVSAFPWQIVLPLALEILKILLSRRQA